MQHQLNAIADGLSDLVRHLAPDLGRDCKELCAAVGLEDREGA